MEHRMPRSAGGSSLRPTEHLACPRHRVRMVGVHHGENTWLLPWGKIPDLTINSRFHPWIMDKNLEIIWWSSNGNFETIKACFFWSGDFQTNPWSNLPMVDTWMVCGIVDQSYWKKMARKPAHSQQNNRTFVSCTNQLLFGDSRWLDLSTWPAQATFILQCWFPDPTEIGDATTPASSISTAEGRVLARLWQSSLAELCRQCRPLSPRAVVGS